MEMKAWEYQAMGHATADWAALCPETWVKKGWQLGWLLTAATLKVEAGS
jgi:hypothetical protein